MGYAIPEVGSLTSGYMVALGHIWASAHPYRGMAWLVAVCGLLAARVGGRGQGRLRLDNHGAETAGATGGSEGRGTGTWPFSAKIFGHKVHQQ